MKALQSGYKVTYRYFQHLGHVTLSVMLKSGQVAKFYPRRKMSLSTLCTKFQIDQAQRF